MLTTLAHRVGAGHMGQFNACVGLDRQAFVSVQARKLFHPLLTSFLDNLILMYIFTVVDKKCHVCCDTLEMYVVHLFS